MGLLSGRKDHPLDLRFYTILLIGAWTLVVLLSIAWRLQQERQEQMALLYHMARSHLEKDLILREWNIRHGYVYAPVTPENLPNPHLNLPEREIVTPSGKVFTAINSSMMIRQVYELARKKLSYQGHLTSLEPLRPENAPDPWERQALEQMQAGAAEVQGMAEINGQPSFRLMQPLRAEPRCLVCHNTFQVGQVAGGISVSLPMAVVGGIWQRTSWAVLLAHGFLWLMGVWGIIFASRQIGQKMRAQQQAEAALRQSEADYRILIQTVPALVYRGYADGRVDFVDDKVAELTGYTREQFSAGEVRWPEIILPEDLPGAKKTFLQALKADGGYRREYRIRRKDGDVLWLAERSQIVLDDRGRIDFICGVVFDISVQKEMERSLKES